MQYWEAVLFEVQHKDDPSVTTYFTDIRKTEEKEMEALRNERKVRRQNPREQDYLEEQRFYVGRKFPNVYFTQREMDVAMQILAGKRIIPAAEALNLSPRTVEFYLKNMRAKLDCANKKQFVEKFKQLKLWQQYDLAHAA